MFSACCRVAFINEYTRYCPKCGQECGIEYKETIPWIKCSELMPTNDENYLIIFREIQSGLFDKNNGAHMNLTRMKYLYEWIPYDEATWRECCLPVSPDNKL